MNERIKEKEFKQAKQIWRILNLMNGSLNSYFEFEHISDIDLVIK